MRKPSFDTWTVYTLQLEGRGQSQEDPGQPEGPSRLRATLTVVAGVAAAYASSVPRRIGDRLFAMNDAEAYWRGWQISKLHGGLARRYRDVAFRTLSRGRQSTKAETENADLDEAG